MRSRRVQGLFPAGLSAVSCEFLENRELDYLVVEQSQGAVKEVCGTGGMGRRDRSRFIRLAEQEGLVSRFEERDCLSTVIDHG